MGWGHGLRVRRVTQEVVQGPSRVVTPLAWEIWMNHSTSCRDILRISYQTVSSW